MGKVLGIMVLMPCVAVVAAGLILVGIFRRVLQSAWHCSWGIVKAAGQVLSAAVVRVSRGFYHIVAGVSCRLNCIVLQPAWSCSEEIVQAAGSVFGTVGTTVSWACTFVCQCIAGLAEAAYMAFTCAGGLLKS